MSCHKYQKWEKEPAERSATTPTDQRPHTNATFAAEIVFPTSVSTATSNASTIKQTGQPGCTPMIKLNQWRLYTVYLCVCICIYMEVTRLACERCFSDQHVLLHDSCSVALFVCHVMSQASDSCSVALFVCHVMSQALHSCSVAQCVCVMSHHKHLILVLLHVCVMSQASDSCSAAQCVCHVMSQASDSCSVAQCVCVSCHKHQILALLPSVCVMSCHKHQILALMPSVCVSCLVTSIRFLLCCPVCVCHVMSQASDSCSVAQCVMSCHKHQILALLPSVCVTSQASDSCSVAQCVCVCVCMCHVTSIRFLLCCPVCVSCHVTSIRFLLCCPVCVCMCHVTSIRFLLCCPVCVYVSRHKHQILALLPSVSCHVTSIRFLFCCPVCVCVSCHNHQSGKQSGAECWTRLRLQQKNGGLVLVLLLRATGLIQPVRGIVSGFERIKT